MSLISIKNINKSYGKKNVLCNVSENVNEGEVLGLLGPSGAGKSTLIKIILGVCKSTSGEILIFGKHPQNLNREDFSKIGIMVEGCELYERFSCYSNLKISGMTSGECDSSTINEALQLVGLSEDAKTKVSELSTGMKQRLHIARAFLNRPKLIILDEPTSGLDPGTAKSIHEVLKNLKLQGTTILLATHNMNEATLLCDRVLLINHGSKVECGTVSELCDKYAPLVTITVRSDKDCIDFNNTKTGKAELAKYIQENKVSDIITKGNTLEEVFLKLTGRGLNDECS